MVARVVGRLFELVHDGLWRREIRVAHAEVDDVLPGAPGLHLQVVDDREDVRREALYASEFHAPNLIRFCGHPVAPRATNLSKKREG
jgi:hypothetical protein